MRLSSFRLPITQYFAYAIYFIVIHCCPAILFRQATGMFLIKTIKNTPRWMLMYYILIVARPCTSRTVTSKNPFVSFVNSSYS